MKIKISYYVSVISTVLKKTVHGTAEQCKFSIAAEVQSLLNSFPTYGMVLLRSTD